MSHFSRIGRSSLRSAWAKGWASPAAAQCMGVRSSSMAKDEKLAGLRIADARALEGAGLPLVRLHGLRRISACLAPWLGALPESWRGM